MPPSDVCCNMRPSDKYVLSVVPQNTSFKQSKNKEEEQISQSSQTAAIRVESQLPMNAAAAEEN